MTTALVDARLALRSTPRRVRWREGSYLLAIVVLTGAELRWLHEVQFLPLLFAAVTVALLLVRFRCPAAALVMVGVVLCGNASAGWVCSPFVSFSVSRNLSRRRFAGAVGGALTAATVTTLAVQRWMDDGSTTLILAGNLLGVLILILVPAACGLLLGHRRQAGRLLRERNAHLERTRELTAARARAQERARIAGEMHDMLGHRLSLLSMHAGALELRTAQDAPALSEQAKLLRTTAGTALEELRQILYLTTPVSAADGRLIPAGLSVGTRGDVQALVGESRAAGFDVRFTWTGEDLADADPRTCQAVHRVVREGLTNVHKHAPTTPGVRVEVTRSVERVRVIVRNAAPQSDRPATGTRRGLVGLEERAAILGGWCSSWITDDGGFTLMMEIPVHPEGLAPAPATTSAATAARSTDAALPTDDARPADGAEPPALCDAQILTPRRTVALLALGAAFLLPTAYALYIIGFAVYLRFFA